MLAVGFTLQQSPVASATSPTIDLPHFSTGIQAKGSKSSGGSSRSRSSGTKASGTKASKISKKGKTSKTTTTTTTTTTITRTRVRIGGVYYYRNCAIEYCPSDSILEDNNSVDDDDSFFPAILFLLVLSSSLLAILHRVTPRNPIRRALTFIAWLTITSALTSLFISVWADKQKVKQAKIAKTCDAGLLTEKQAEEIIASSSKLEAQADRFATQGKHQEAVQTYIEASAAQFNEASANGTVAEIEEAGGLDSDVDSHKKIFQRIAEVRFKVGQSYSRLGKHENAINCFDESLFYRIAPPNDAIVYLNRCDAYLQMGDKPKALADCQKSASLFQQYKLPAYQKMAVEKLKLAK